MLDSHLHTSKIGIQHAGGLSGNDSLSGEVDDILHRAPLSEKSTVLISDNGCISVDLSVLSFCYTLQTALTKLFDEGFYLVDIDYPRIMDIIYNFEGMRAEVKSPIIQIGSSIKTFDPNRRIGYNMKLLKKSPMNATYDFQNVFIRELNQDGINEENKMILNIDEFIAFLWIQGICYGIDIAKIKQAILSDKPTKDICIANGLSVIPGKNAKIVHLRRFDTDLGLREHRNGTLDMRGYIRPIVQVSKDENLYQKIPLQNGSSGRDIHGNIIRPVNPKDIDLSSFCGKGVYIKTINEFECILADRDGYPIITNSKDGELVGIDISDVYRINSSIGVRTGQIQTTGDVTIIGGIDRDYHLIARVIRVSGEINGGIYAIGDIVIDAGSARGIFSKNTIDQIPTRKNGVTPGNGEIVSNEGNITIHGFAEKTYIEAKKGTISVHHLIQSTIIADTVSIIGNVTGCTIVANHIICTGKVTNCTLIAGMNIDIKESRSGNTDTNIVCLHFRDYNSLISKKHEIRLQKINEIQTIENGIDKELVKEFNTLGNIEAGKRKSMTRILLDLMKDPAKLQREEHRSHLMVYEKVKFILHRNGTNWILVKKLNDDLTQISRKIALEEEVMEKYKKESFIKIFSITGSLDMQYIASTNTTEFLDIPYADIRSMIHGSSEGMRNNKIDAASGPKILTFTKNKIIPPSHTPFHWKPIL